MITSLLAAYITTKAAVAVVFPIALSVAINSGVPGTPFVLAVAYAAACTFITPHGYVTNLMVYGPGGYSFRDFMQDRLAAYHNLYGSGCCYSFGGLFLKDFFA